ncbi:hypothetical protein J6590_008523 [Homalodisca vitripennis]|nr:hypothetical protein J6590_008523 [Homalodisca vitripennis]
MTMTIMTQMMVTQQCSQGTDLHCWGRLMVISLALVLRGSMMVTQQCSQGTDLHCWGRLMVISLALRGSVIGPKW